jgi:hypothetical protein
MRIFRISKMLAVVCCSLFLSAFTTFAHYAENENCHRISNNCHVAISGNQLVCHNDDGNQLWANKSQTSLQQIAVSKDKYKIYVVSDNQLICFNKDGKQLWSSELKGNINQNRQLRNNTATINTIQNNSGKTQYHHTNDHQPEHLDYDHH